MSNPTMHAVAYRLIAQALGRALAYIMHEQGISQEPMAFKIIVSALIRDFEDDNPKFDARRFRRVLEAARLSEYEDGRSDQKAPKATSRSLAKAEGMMAAFSRQSVKVLLSVLLDRNSSMLHHLDNLAQRYSIPDSDPDFTELALLILENGNDTSSAVEKL